MAINVNMTGSGEIGEIQPGWTVNEYATPATIGDTAGGTGTVNIAAGKKPTSKLIVNNSITTTHDVLGSISGDVRTVSTVGPSVSLSHSAPLAKFDADANIPALYSGGIYPAIDICSQLIGENQLKLGLPGWYGSLAGHGALFNASGGRVYGSAYYVNYRFYNPTTGKYETQRIAAATDSVGAGSHGFASNGIMYATNLDGDSFNPDPTVTNTNYVTYRTYVPGSVNHIWSFEGNPIDNDFDYGFTGYLYIDPVSKTLTVGFDYASGGTPTGSYDTVDITTLDFTQEFYVFIKYSFKKNANGTCDFNLNASVSNVSDAATYFSASTLIQLFNPPTWYSKWSIVGYVRNLWRYGDLLEIGNSVNSEYPIRINYAQNPSFESGIAGWAADAYNTAGSLSTTLTNDTVQKFIGTKSLKIATPSAASTILFNNGAAASNVSPSTGYMYAIYLKFPSSSSNVSVYPQVYEYDQNNNIDFVHDGQQIFSITNTWQRYYVYFYTSLTAKKVFLSFTIQTNDNSNGIPTSFNVDAALLKKWDGTSDTYFDASLTPPAGLSYVYEVVDGQTVSSEYQILSSSTPEIPFVYDIPLNVDNQSTPPSYAGTAIGFKGNMWDYIQSACSAYGKEVAVIDNIITLRDVGVNVLDITNIVASPTITPTATLTGKSVEIVTQNSTNITDDVVYDAYKDDNKILSVKAGESVTTTIDAKTYLTSVFQPERRFQLPNDDGCYIVSDSTGLPIPTSKTIKLDITAISGSGTFATITTKSPHGIKPGDVVTISGVTPAGYNANSVIVATVPTATTFLYANTTTGAQTKAGKVTYTSATTMWEDYGGSLEVSISEEVIGGIVVKLTGPTKEIPGYSGPYKIAAIADGNDFAALSIIGRGVKSEPKNILIQTGAAVSKTSQDIAKTINNPFIQNEEMAYDRGIWASIDASGPRVTLSGTIPTNDISKFGITAGSQIIYEDCQFRITDASISNIGISFNASRFVDVSDFNSLWSTKTVAYHDGVWDAFDTQDQIIMPLYGDHIVNGYIGFDDDSTPYLKVTGTGDGDASLLFDEDLTRTNYVLNSNFTTDTNYWLTAGTLSLTRDTSTFKYGPACGYAFGASVNNYIYTTVSLSSSSYVKYWASTWFLGNAGKVYFIQFGSKVLNFTATGVWQRVSVSQIYTGTVSPNFYIGVRDAGVYGFYVDGVQVTTGATLVDYFDGSSTDTSTVRYEWSGTPNASTSLMYTKTPYYVPIDSTHLPTLLELDVDFSPYYV